MGFDTSYEPILYSQEVWENFNNIDYRCASWDDLEDIKVSFSVDCIIWSGVLLYRPNDHLDFFKFLSKQFYNAKYAIIQEPLPEQKHWLQGLKLNTIAHELNQYKETFKSYRETIVDLDIFSGRRAIVEIEL